jgi:hypothetical protein
LARILLERGFFCRGGVASGLTFHDQGVVLGIGPQEAYGLESQAANYPRILVSDSIASRLQGLLGQANELTAVKQDFDGCWFIDIFWTVAEGCHESNDFEELERCRNLIAAKLVEDEPLKRAARWRWAANHFDAALAALKLSAPEPFQLKR